MVGVLDRGTLSICIYKDLFLTIHTYSYVPAWFGSRDLITKKTSLADLDLQISTSKAYLKKMAKTVLKSIRITGLNAGSPGLVIQR